MTFDPQSSPLPAFLINKAVTAALEEDLGLAGDLTTNAVVPAEANASGQIVARKPGVIAGLQLAEAAFKTLSSDMIFSSYVRDGQKIESGQIIAEITGSSRILLTGERVALNFLGHLSGIATLTHHYVQAVKGTKAQICCTRKTLPGLRAFQKYAVKAGGGMNHRFGLDDAVMIKDNHIALAGGLKQAVTEVKRKVGHMVKIEVEVDALSQLEELLNYDIDVVLLDNMTAETLKTAVEIVAGRFVTEASGGVNLETVRQIALSGVDLISIGALTHSAPCLDLGLDFNSINA